MHSYDVQIKRVNGNEDIPLPVKMTEAASGFDLHAAVPSDITLMPMERRLIPTGFAMSMPVELEAQIRPRSGLAYKHGITTLNSPGTIDADYRGEVHVLLINLSQVPFTVARGERIAQLVFQEVPRVNIQEVLDLDETVRGSGGFGHTGK